MAAAAEAGVAGSSRRGPPDPSEVARVHLVDGHTVLVGRSAKDNDTLALKVARPRDLWLHAAGVPGSHVVVRRPDGGEVPRAVLERAAQLAAWHSKARNARGKVAVHWCVAAEVSKVRGAPPGQVRLGRHEVIRVYPRGDDDDEEGT